MPRTTSRFPRRAVLGALAALLAVSGCRGVAVPDEPESGPDLDGIVGPVGTPERPQRVHVVDVAVPERGYDAGVILDLGSAPIFVRQADGTLARGELSDVRPGVRLRAWSTGVELRSLPPQWSATRVEVVRP